MFAVDWAESGFVQQGLWVGVDGVSASVAWIEVGVTHGRDQNEIYFFTAHGDSRIPPDGFFFEAVVPGTPVINENNFYKVVNCAGQDPGCPTPFDPSSSPEIFVACRGDSQALCVTWEVGLGAGTLDYWEGVESTCGTLSSSDKSRVDKTYVSSSQLRYLSSWINIASTSGSDGGVNSSFIGKSPGASTIHDIECCSGTVTSGGKTRCQDPGKSRYWLNSQTPTGTCN